MNDYEPAIRRFRAKFEKIYSLAGGNGTVNTTGAQPEKGHTKWT